MGIATRHPCNAFNGWLFVSRDVARQAMQQQLRLRDDEVEKDRNASGEPAAFLQWSIEQVRGLAAEPAIAQQIAGREQELQQRLASREQAMVEQIAAFQAETDKIAADLEMLRSITAKVACQ